MKKIKLGILSTHPIQYYVPLYRYLTQQGELELTVFYCQKPSPEQQGVGFNISFAWDIDLTSGYHHIWLVNKSTKPSLQDFWGCNTPEIATIIREQKFDAFLVLGWYTQSLWQAIIACWITNTPILVRGDSHLRILSPWYKQYLKKITYPLFISRFSCCLAVGQWSADYFAYYKAKKVFCSPHFVDNGWFQEQLEKQRPYLDKIKQKWNIPDGSTVYLFAGKFEEKKRPLDFLNAFLTLHEILPSQRKIFGLMVGDGILKGECQTFITRHNLPITLAGFLNQSEMPQAYLVSDVIVLPSDARETWGLVVNEAMACGIPAIVSDQVGCNPDLLQPDQTGIVYPCGDTSALGQAMLSLADKSLSRKLGNQARQHISNFSVDQAGHAIIKAIQAVIQ